MKNEEKKELLRDLDDAPAAHDDAQKSDMPEIRLDVETGEISGECSFKGSMNYYVEKPRVAVFPGSFDPFTVGHKAVLDMALPLFDKVIVAIGANPEKNTHLLTFGERIDQIKKLYKDNKKVEVLTYNSLTAHFCEEHNASFIIRGLRNTIDFEYEKQLAQTNKELSGVETVFFITPPEYAHVSSSMVRELEKHNADIRKYVYSI